MTAKFDGRGWLLKPSHGYRVYFPFIKHFDLDPSAIPLDYTSQTQTGNDTYTHLGAFDYLASDVVTPTGGALNFMMKHVGSILVFKLTVEEPGTFDSMTLTAENPVFTTKASLNITGQSPVLSSSEKKDNMVLSLQNVSTTEANEFLGVYS